ncbi:flagellar basal body P-ring formation chaperone FlgA [Teredinibacter purpureus]|uniref:flagellar basal body P-ring formation chaperone FlgA n=1 Tax=Teredinibacter purpureus TaxID=2731756 RepID=UPI0006989DA5|nr:flagellar basal body P-ring formation chaperone FlgA [Teredinibacter purpureus]
MQQSASDRVLATIEHRYFTKRFIFAIGVMAGLTFSLPALSVEIESIENIRSQVQQKLEHYVQERYPQLSFGDDLTVQVGRIDRRLQLLKCPSPLTLKINEQSTAANVTIKTGCASGPHWSIYVTGTVQIFRNVVVAAHSLARGETVSESDLTFQRLDTARLSSGYIDNPKRVIGMELKRPLRAQDIVKLSTLKQPNLVRKGDTVVLRAKASHLTVETEGTALSNGYMGQQIKVRNEHSRRIVDGLVMGPGEVQVTL